MHSTQFVCPLSVNLGACESKFHRRIVESPLPLAKFFPSLENATLSTASACPAIAAEHRVTARTRNTLCG